MKAFPEKKAFLMLPGTSVSIIACKTIWTWFVESLPFLCFITRHKNLKDVHFAIKMHYKGQRVKWPFNFLNQRDHVIVVRVIDKTPHILRQFHFIIIPDRIKPISFFIKINTVIGPF